MNASGGLLQSIISHLSRCYLKHRNGDVANAILILNFSYRLCCGTPGHGIHRRSKNFRSFVQSRHQGVISFNPKTLFSQRRNNIRRTSRI